MTAKSYAGISFIAGLLGMLLSCLGVVVYPAVWAGIACGGIGVVLAAIAGRTQRYPAATGGMILSILGLIIGVGRVVVEMTCIDFIRSMLP